MVRVYSQLLGNDGRAEGHAVRASSQISAVVFTVPGTERTDTPYNFCVNGFAYGSTAADAPDGTAVQGDQMGTIGGTGATRTRTSQRVKVKADGHDYIIQNNNWGNPRRHEPDADATRTTASRSRRQTGTGGDAPASFPSIYIGNNGNTANGMFSTQAGRQSADPRFRPSPASPARSATAARPAVRSTRPTTSGSPTRSRPRRTTTASTAS